MSPQRTRGVKGPRDTGTSSTCRQDASSDAAKHAGVTRFGCIVLDLET